MEGLAEGTLRRPWPRGPPAGRAAGLPFPAAGPQTCAGAWAGVPVCARGRRAGRGRAGSSVTSRRAAEARVSGRAWRPRRVAPGRTGAEHTGRCERGEPRRPLRSAYCCLLGLENERPCLERGCAAHPERRARPDAEPFTPDHRSLPGAARRPERLPGPTEPPLGEQRRGRGSPRWFKGDRDSVSSLQVTFHF